jgi:carboxypeptidase Taq
MSNTKQLYAEYVALMQQAADLNNAAALLEWDHEVYMPAKGAAARGRQLATLSSMAHEILTGKEFERVITELAGKDGLSDTEEANVRISLEDFEKNRKLPSSFVSDLSHQTTACYNAWIEARQKSDYNIYKPHLAKMIALKQRQAKLYGYENHPYDALLDDYEKGANTVMLDAVFTKIKTLLPPVLSKIKSSAQVSNECFLQFFPKESQWDFSVDVLRKMGFDFEAGRQDYSEHPFTTSFAPTDVRVTTRVSEDNFASLLWSTIHEGGHALYEQGLPMEQYGLPLASAASLGIHESQSRFWENCIGRGHDFWKFFYPKLQRYFLTQLGKVNLDTFYKAMNRVEPSLIRTEADEVTYHFHVLIRYEIEKALLGSELKADDLQAAWNDRYTHYLGVTPPNDVKGILQDVHWSHGSFGYFPTYSLGSFYAAQFYAEANKQIPDLSTLSANGDYTLLLQWLRENVHVHGRRYTSEELCERITGEKLDIGYFMQYIEAKYAAIYV